MRKETAAITIPIPKQILCSVIARHWLKQHNQLQVWLPTRNPGFCDCYCLAYLHAKSCHSRPPSPPIYWKSCLRQTAAITKEKTNEKSEQIRSLHIRCSNGKESVRSMINWVPKATHLHTKSQTWQLSYVY